MADGTERGYGIALLSGGLDSILAVRLLLEQGVRVDALHFRSAFSDTRLDIEAVARDLGVRLDVLDHTRDLVEAVRDPAHGTGRHLNPCIDCRVRMIRRADRVREERGAHFLVTGEVLGQRPMSQRRGPMDVVEKRGGVTGRLLRPLSARLLPPTDAETRGLVDRDRLLDLSGRSRKEQLAMAERFGITTFLTPAGGCLLTQAHFSAKARDLMEHGEFTEERAPSLRPGRHFRLDDGVKIVVGRNERDNRAVERAALPFDRLLRTVDPPGPSALVCGSGGQPPSAATLDRAARLAAAYARARDGQPVSLELYLPGRDAPERLLAVSPLSREEAEAFLLRA